MVTSKMNSSTHLLSDGSIMRINEVVDVSTGCTSAFAQIFEVIAVPDNDDDDDNKLIFGNGARASTYKKIKARQERHKNKMKKAHQKTILALARQKYKPWVWHDMHLNNNESGMTCI